MTRVALVTGSSRGIGAAAVDALAAAGLTVVGVARTQPAQSRCSATIVADLADPDAPRRIVEEVGRIDVLVNNAGVLIVKPIDDFTLAEFEQLVALNLRAVFLRSQAVVPGMRERGWGRIVNVSSIGARTGGFTPTAVYAATKAGVLALTKSFARFYGPHGITANAVAPGGIETSMATHLDDERRQEYFSQIPLRRFANPSEVGSVIAFLASDAASFVTGATIDVNGGWAMT
jgi:3-oxoacyl-[acyl-carrier protein] reductase